MNNQKIDYILAIDAGGSKTAACLKCLNTKQIWYKKAADASLSHDLDRACKTIDNLAKRFFEDAPCDPNNILLVCGVAGGGNQAKRKVLFDRLSRSFDHIHIYNDGKISLFGAGGGEPRIVLTIGTGSIATRLDKTGIESRFGGWGFVAGDLGSGAYMGKQLVRSALVQYDKQQAQQPGDCDQLLSETIARLSITTLNKTEVSDKGQVRATKEINQGNNESSKQTIANWIQRATPTDYAAFAPLIFQYVEQSHYAVNLIEDTACWVEDLAKTAGFETKEYGDIPVVIVGGLAQAITPFLSQNLSKTLVPSKGNSLDGAVYIGEHMVKKTYQ